MTDLDINTGVLDATETAVDVAIPRERPAAGLCGVPPVA